MAQVTSPIILDSTGQQIHSDLQQIKTVLTTPSAAEDITFDNTGTGMQADDVQDAITELKSNLTELSDYSTTEQAVGKWIDGKTLYRVIYTCASFNIAQSSSVVSHTVYTAPSNTTIIKYSCMLNSGTSKYMLPYSNANKTSSCVGIGGTTPYIQIRVVNDSWSSVTVTSEVYYTKNS